MLARVLFDKYTGISTFQRVNKINEANDYHSKVNSFFYNTPGHVRGRFDSACSVVQSASRDAEKMFIHVHTR